MRSVNNSERDYSAGEIEAAAQRIASECPDCTCEDVLDQLFELLDHELPAEEEQRLRLHAQNCSACQNASRHEMTVRSRIRRSCNESAPSELRMRVVSQIVTLRTQRMN